MKKILLVIVLSISVFLFACSQKNHFEFNFDNFYGYFFTKNDFTISKTKAEGLGYGIIQNDIIKAYQKTSGSGFKDNIIIAKKHSDRETKDFAEIMISTTKTNGFKADNMKSAKITCKNEKIPIYYINSKIARNLNTTYLSFSFFKQDEYIYIISFATQDEEERNTFASDIKNIKCKK